MNYYERHIGDYLKDTSHLSLLEHGIYGRLLDVYYTRESAIPEAQAARLIGARSKDERDALTAVLGEFFELVDGAWHQSRCDAEIDAYLGKQAEKPAAKDNAKERQRRARERRAQLFEALRSHGITMPYKATTAELEAELSRVTSQHASHGVTRDITPPVTRDDTATQTPVPRHQSFNTPAPATRAQAADSEVFPIAEGWQPSDTFAVQAKLMGLPVLDPDAMAEGLAEFTAFWLTRPGELRTQAAWENALAQSLKRRQVKAAEASARQATAPRAQRPSNAQRTPNHGGHDAVEPA